MDFLESIFNLLDDDCEVTIHLTDEDEADEPEEGETEESIEQKLDEMRKKLSSKIGEEQAGKVDEVATNAAVLSQMLQNGVPLKMEIVEKYNKLCLEVFPETRDEYLLNLLYNAIEYVVRKE